MSKLTLVVDGNLGRDAVVKEKSMQLNIAVAQSQKVDGEWKDTPLWITGWAYPTKISQYMVKGATVRAVFDSLRVHEHDGKSYLQGNIIQIDLIKKAEGTQTTSGGGSSNSSDDGPAPWER